MRRHNTGANLSAGVLDLIRNEVQNVKCVRHVIEVENHYVSPNIKDFIITLDTDSELDSEREEDDLQ
jgi:hypothetical protein